MASSVKLLCFFVCLILSQFGATLQVGNGGSQINSNSVLVALLDSRYTELAELVEKANLLQTLEDAVTKHNITIFAPRNEAVEPEFKQFLLAPANLRTLQNLILHHIAPNRVGPSDSTRVVDPYAVDRPDGVIHGIDRLLIPRSVQIDFNNRRSISAVKPEAAPEIDPRTNRLKKPVQPGSAPVLPIYSAMAPGPSLAPAPAPGPGGPVRHLDGETQVKDFIETLVQYGGYNEMADILVNLTSLAAEMGRLVSEGYVITVLAPNDEAMAKLTTDQLGEPEQIMYYHMIPEYQTEESMYNAVRRFGSVGYETLRLPHRVVAREADDSVRFGHGDGSAYLFDPDIYTDGRISVQGIDGVLFPPNQEVVAAPMKVAAKPARRGKLLEVGCLVLGAFGKDSHFTACQ